MKPAANLVASPVMDKYDEEEPEPEAVFFDAQSETLPIVAPTVKPVPKKTLQTEPLDTSLDPVVTVTKKDAYPGESLLRLTNDEQPIDPNIHVFPRKKTIPYNQVTYSEAYNPPETEPTPVEEIEPVSVPVPSVPNIVPPKPEATPPPRRSKRLDTTWGPATIVKALLTTALVGVTLLPTSIIAEPVNGLKDTGNSHLHPDPIFMKPLSKEERHNNLRAYHARLDLMNEVMDPDPTNRDWQAQSIDSFVVRGEGESTRILLKVTWFGGDKQWVQMDDMRLHDPFLVLRYGIRNNYLNQPGWEWAKHFMSKDPQLLSIARCFRVAQDLPNIKFGIEVPKNTKHANEIDRLASSDKWKQSNQVEMKQINDYKTFITLEDGEPMPPGYKRIPYHCIYDVKFDGRYKCRLVAGGHRTDPPKEDVFSGVVSMEAVRLGFILSRLNGLQVCAGDVGNAFLYGKTNENVFIIAGPEFGPEVEGKRLIIDKSLYGLKSSAARFHEHLSVTLKKMGYRPTKADPDLWYTIVDDHYEYIARFVDDVISFSKDPMKVMEELKTHYVMKGVGKPQYYLGGDVIELGEEWEKQDIGSAFSAETYIANCLPKQAAMCGLTQFTKAHVPFSDTYYPELDESPLCSPLDITKYKSLLGSGNWIITLGRFDIAFSISSLSRYSMAPRYGHLEALKQVFGYLRRMPDGRILIDTSQPPVRKTAVVTKGQNWVEFYPDACEDLPHDMLKPKGGLSTLTCYVDADHARDKLTRRSVTGIVLLLNNTPIVWLSKRQKTVETSTYGSELIASRIAVDLILSMRYKLRMLGLTLEHSSMMVGDNMSVVLNTTIPSSSLKKKHLACNYHRVREAVAARIIDYGHIPSEANLADIATKPLPRPVFERLTSMYLFRRPLTVTYVPSTSATHCVNPTYE